MSLRYVIKPYYPHTYVLKNRQPYRSRGLGSQSLKEIITAATAHLKPKIDSIYLHVQISNQAAKTFYERHGFKEIAVHENYYKKLVPHDAWILERRIASTEEQT